MDSKKIRRVLFIAYYFPPLGMGGVQRSLKFVKYLPEFYWEPIVLTVTDVAYYAKDYTLLREIEERKIYRTNSFDPLRIFRKIIERRGSEHTSQREISFWHRMNRIFTPLFFLPDTKILWIPHAFKKAMEIIKKERIDLIFTTSPPHSVHLLGIMLKKTTNLPWVADFRDNWLTEEYEKMPTPIHKFLNKKMVLNVITKADRIITISNPIAEYFREISDKKKSSIVTIPNGYDMEDFKNVKPICCDRFTITYCGTLNHTRTPERLFEGIYRAIARDSNIKAKICLRIVGTIFGIDINRMIDKYGLRDVIQIIGYVNHHKSIEYLVGSDMAVLLISSDSSRAVVTGKIYEYLASGRPILAIVPQGEAERLVIENSRGTVVHPDDTDSICSEILRYFNLWQKGRLRNPVSRWKGIKIYERRRLTGIAAEVFDGAVKMCD